MPRVDEEVAATGIDSTPGPRLPFTMKRTCHEPLAMIQSAPVKKELVLRGLLHLVGNGRVERSLARERNGSDLNA
jgi:hypothetical protein